MFLSIKTVINQLILIGFLLPFFSCDYANSISELANHEFRNGDIIFHQSNNEQSKAIRLATSSKYTHMGIIYEKDDKFYVYEAVGPVKLTPLEDWIKRGIDGHYVLKRLKNADDILNDEALLKMKSVGDRFEKKPYDFLFNWSNDEIYCSELVWKIYHEALGIDIGKLELLKDFDLSSPEVKNIMKERYGNDVPLNEKVISPIAMFNSDLLVSVN